MAEFLSVFSEDASPGNASDLIFINELRVTGSTGEMVADSDYCRIVKAESDQ
jgi:hypothetical protein